MVHEKTVPESQFRLRKYKSLEFARLETGTSNGGHLAALSRSVDEKIGFPDHSCRYEFYNNRSALIEIVPLEEGQLYRAGKDPSATGT